MSKHTPGPWIVTDDVNAHVIRGAEQKHTEHDIKFVFREFVASIWGGYHEANARLIAAAPDLLEALEELVPLTEDKRVREIAIRAIAKAIGEDHA